MAQHEDSESQFDPMHRIIGAVILVTLAVILVPLVLQQREFPSANTATTRLDASATKIVVSPVGVAANTDAQRDVATLPTNGEDIDALPPSAAAQENSTPLAAASKPVAAPVLPSAPPPQLQAIEHGWVVQLGTYANPKNADRMHAKLKELGYVVSMEPIQLRNGKATRVRVGPYAEKTEAMSMQTELKKQVGLNGVVLAYP